MKTFSRSLFLCALGLLGTPAQPQATALANVAHTHASLNPPVLSAPETPKTPMNHAKGSFEVKITRDPRTPGESIASFTMEKHYTGDLEASAAGEMLSVGDPQGGNAGYVAMERVTGKLGGRAGSFAIMQYATMSTGVAPQLTATIVPGSGTGELSGIYGTVTLNADGKHSYTLDYAFAAK